MSGPLTHCFTCCKGLYRANKILANIKKTELRDQDINVMLASDQLELLGNKKFEVMNDLDLLQCCRSSLGCVDHTSIIHG